MAHECTDQSSSVTISPSTQPNWWDLHHNHNHHRHANSVSSWINSIDSTWHQQHQPNPSSNNSSCDEDISKSTTFTNASNHSGLTVDSSRRLVETASSSNELMGEHAPDSQLWSHLLLGIGSNGDLHNNQEVGDSSLDAPSTKNLSSGIFEPACDYLKKPNNSWEFSNSLQHLNNYEKHMNVFNDSLTENEKLSKLVNNWSITSPDQLICNISLCSSLNQHYSQPHAYSDSNSYAIGSNRDSSIGLLSSCHNGRDIKVENHEHRDNIEAPGVYFRRSFNGNNIGYNLGLNNSVIGDNKYYNPRSDVSCGTKNIRDVINFNGRFSKQLIDIKVPKPGLKSVNLSDGRKLTSSPTAGRGNEGKKKRQEETSDTILKKPKYESSTASSVKAPKVKLGDRITALQQIVSPFGKTDTASVLYEAIQYIKFLQEQVQLLSNPYMKTNSHKDPWGSLDRKNKGDAKLDMRSRGLCLVPISCTPQVCHENTGTDYWTPTYRGCLYR